MFFILSKVLGVFCNPLVWATTCLLLSLILKSNKLKKRLRVVSIIILLLFSNQAIYFEVVRLWNPETVQYNAIDKEYEVAIILGGIVSLDRKHKLIEFHDNADRFLNVLPLYFNGTVKKILISGGSGRVFHKNPESTILQSYLIDIGVKPKDIIIEDQSRNTYENAKYSTEIIRKLNIPPPYLLSTSSMHMRRSQLCFKKQNLTVDPLSVDQKIYKRELALDTLFLPNPTILSYWYQLIHEWIGVLSYKVSGYI